MSLLLLAFACTGPPAGSEDGPDTLVIGIPADPVNLLHPTATNTVEMNVADLLNAPTFRPEFLCTLELNPGLYTVKEETHDSLTVSLDPRFRWEDGTPVSAKDVIASWALGADPNTGSPRQASYAKLAGPPEALDDATLRFRFAAPMDATGKRMIASLGLSDHARLNGVDPTTLKTNEANVRPRSSGPWRLAERQPGMNLRFEPNPEWPVDGEPRLGALELRIIEDPVQRLLALKNHEVDVIENVTPADADTLAAENPEIALRRRGWRFLEYVAWNGLDPTDLRAKRADPTVAVDLTTVRPHPLFGDPAVRRALTQAIDVDRILRLHLTSQVYGDIYGRPAVGTVSPALCGLHNNGIVRIRTDAAAAKAALAGQGWTDTDGDGILDKEGIAFQFPLLINAGNTLRADVAELIAEDLRKVGVDARIEVMDPATFQARLRNKDFAAAISGINASLVPDQTNIWGRDAPMNSASWIDPEAEQLMSAALAASDPVEAVKLHHQWQERVYAAQPYSFLYWRDDIVAIHARLENTRVDLIYPWGETWKWRVAPERVLRPAR